MSHFKVLKKLLTSCFILIALNQSNIHASDDGLKLHWKAPVKYVTGSDLNAKKDLKEYRLYYGSSEENIRDNVVFLAPSSTSVSLSLLQLSKLKVSLIYFAMTSVSKAGSESELSPTIFYLP